MKTYAGATATVKPLSKVRSYVLYTIFSFCVTGFQVAQAVAPQLYFRMPNTVLAGNLKDGAQLGQGRIVSEEIHSGFELMFHTPSGRDPSHLRLNGKQKNNSKLNVRVVTESNTPVSFTGNRLHFLTENKSITFQILLDGDQNVVSDNYSLTMSAAVIPDSE